MSLPINRFTNPSKEEWDEYYRNRPLIAHRTQLMPFTKEEEQEWRAIFAHVYGNNKKLVLTEN